MAAAFEESVVPYIEAVASTIEGRADGRAWHDFELVTARAILLSYLLGLSQVIEDAEIAGADFFSDKSTYAKSDCGAGDEDAPGFQPGNTCAGEGGDAWDSKQAVSEIAGGVLKTGVPVSVPYLRNLSSATKLHGKPNKESPYDRWYEPSGEYLTPMDSEPEPQEGFKTGTIQFENPIVLHAGEYGEDSSWKKSLSERYGGLVGKRLSQAIIDDGYDAIFTVDKYGPSEAVNLQTFDISKAKYASKCGAGDDDAPGFQPGNTCAGDGDGKAEPGESRHKTSTPEFKAWFGDSKVVDDDGEPLVMYHGTNVEFDEFDPNKNRSVRNEQFQGDGFFFTDDLETAWKYADAAANQTFDPKRVVEEIKQSHPGMPADLLELQVKHGFDEGWRLTLEKHDLTGKPVSEWPDDGVDLNDISEIAEWVEGSKVTTEESGIDSVMSALSGTQHSMPEYIKDTAVRLGLTPPTPTIVPVYLKANRILETSDSEKAKRAQANGYDGVKYTGPGRVGDAAEWIVFQPTQIKSATDNTGSFDPDNPKITHAKATYAKEDWPMEVGFEEFAPEPFQEAIDLFEDRVPMLAHNVPHIAAIAKQQAADIAMAERMGVVAKLDAQSNAISKSLGQAFWVSDVDMPTTIALKDLIGQAMRGVMPDERMTLPEFISRAWLEGAQNLTAARLETIYRTNLQSAFTEGHMASMRSPEVKSVAPLAMIVEIQDPRSRDHHAAMDGYINTVEYFDRFQIAPPNGFNCRGTVRVVSWTEAENLGLVGDDGEIDWKALERYNGNRQGYIDRGEYPDPGFTDRAA